MSIDEVAVLAAAAPVPSSPGTSHSRIVEVVFAPPVEYRNIIKACITAASHLGF